MKGNLFSIKGLLFFILLVGVGFNAAYAKQSEGLRKLKKIEVLKSTRAEVEKLFGNPNVIEIRDLAVEFKNGWGKEVSYETKYGRLEVWFGAGKCSESREKRFAFDVATDVAAMLTFYPNETIFENQLGYDLSKFENDSASDTDKTYTYENEKILITIEVKNFQVSSIEFGIPEKHKAKLECKNFKVKEPVWLEKLRTLEVFKSTRRDVEALFDNPKILVLDDSAKNGDDALFDVDYETAYGELQVKYSTGRCYERNGKYGYDAAQDTLVELRFLPTEKVDPTEINFDSRRAKSEENAKLGVEVGLDNQKVQYIKFFPNEKAEELDCEKVLNLQK